MNAGSLSQRLAVCSWSLQAATPAELIERVQATGVPRVQLALDPLRHDAARWSDTATLLQRNNISIVSGMFGCAGEDYTTLESIRRTGGIAPDATWEQNWQEIQAAAGLAQALHLKLVTFHAGFLPHDPADPQFAKLKQRVEQIAALFAERGIALGMETGQETAAALRDFLQGLNQPNLGVNFDPANMILYDKGDPIAAVRTLGPWIRQVHIKDANRTATPGTWGAEVPAGTGQVDWPAFFGALRETGFAGDLCIEREAGTQRVTDIRAARMLVEQISA